MPLFVQASVQCKLM